MIDQDRIETRIFQPEDMIKLKGNTETIAANARLNQVAGPAHSIYIDGKVMYCGGVRINGVGEPWACFQPQIFKENAWDVLKKSRQMLEKYIRQEHLWRLWTYMSVPDEKYKAFLKRLNFNQIEAFVR
jgi:hypothetical protein